MDGNQGMRGERGDPGVNVIYLTFNLWSTFF